MVWEYGLSVAEVNLEMASLRRHERNAMCSQPSSKLAVLHVQSHHLDTATLQQLCCVSNKNVASSHGRKMAMVAQALACPTCLRVTRYGGANGGNGLRQADSEIQDEAVEWEVEAQDNTETFQSHTRTVDDHSTESVGGSRRSRRWARSSCSQADPRAWRPWMICTRPLVATSTWWWGRSSMPRWVATCRSRSRVCARAWPGPVSVCRRPRHGWGQRGSTCCRWWSI